MHKDDTCIIQVLSFNFTISKVQVFFFAIFFRISKTAASRINVNSNHSIDTRTHSPLVCTTIRIKLINSWQEIYSMKKGHINTPTKVGLNNLADENMKNLYNSPLEPCTILSPRKYHYHIRWRWLKQCNSKKYE